MRMSLIGYIFVFRIRALKSPDYTFIFNITPFKLKGFNESQKTKEFKVRLYTCPYSFFAITHNLFSLTASSLKSSTSRLEKVSEPSGRPDDHVHATCDAVPLARRPIQAAEGTS